MPVSLQAVKTKPVVKYQPLSVAKIEVGLPAVVIAEDHYSHLIFPGEVVRTSTVLQYDEESGDFETRNTFYRRS
jgi:hypothetical protein